MMSSASCIYYSTILNTVFVLLLIILLKWHSSGGLQQSWAVFGTFSSEFELYASRRWSSAASRYSHASFCSNMYLFFFSVPKLTQYFSQTSTSHPLTVISLLSYDQWNSLERMITSQESIPLKGHSVIPTKSSITFWYQLAKNHWSVRSSTAWAVLCSINLLWSCRCAKLTLNIKDHASFCELSILFTTFEPSLLTFGLLLLTKNTQNCNSAIKIYRLFFRNVGLPWNRSCLISFSFF